MTIDPKAIEAAKRIVAQCERWNPAELRDDAIVARAHVAACEQLGIQIAGAGHLQRKAVEEMHRADKAEAALYGKDGEIVHAMQRAERAEAALLAADSLLQQLHYAKDGPPNGDGICVCDERNNYGRPNHYGECTELRTAITAYEAARKVMQ